MYVVNSLSEQGCDHPRALQHRAYFSVFCFSTGEPGGGGRAQGSSTVDVCEAAAKTRTLNSRSGPSVATENAGVGGPGAATGSSGGAVAGAGVKVELTFARETDGATSGTGRGGGVVV